MSPNDADGMANNVDPDQTAPLGAVWSGSALFAQAYLSENLGSLCFVWPISQKYNLCTKSKLDVNHSGGEKKQQHANSWLCIEIH